jgi:hypothetical protein
MASIQNPVPAMFSEAAAADQEREHEGQRGGVRPCWRSVRGRTDMNAQRGASRHRRSIACGAIRSLEFGIQENDENELKAISKPEKFENRPLGPTIFSNLQRRMANLPFYSIGDAEWFLLALQPVFR